MSATVCNIEEISIVLDVNDIPERFCGWFTKKLKKEIPNRPDWLKIHEPDNLSDPHVKKSVDAGENVFIFTLTPLLDEFMIVADWLAELEQRDARLFAKLDRITWKQAVEHSTRWHEALARAAEKSKMKTIPFNDDCPVIMECDDGMKWVWLKTDKARDDEGNVMGHCVGNGGYDQLDHHSGVFSLRDGEGRPHVTVELYRDLIIQSKMKSNLNVSMAYFEHVNALCGLMFPKLSMRPKLEGMDHLIWWNGDEEWYKNGYIHSKSGPAAIKSNGDLEWYKHGELHRENGPAIIAKNGDLEWWVNGRRHREDGPAVELADGTKEWYRNDMRHREDGPAVERMNGRNEWWINGIKSPPQTILDTKYRGR